MKLLIVPSRQGVSWLRRGFRVFLRQPLAFCALFVCLFVLYLLMLQPVIGPFLLALLPLSSLVFMIATRLALQGRFPLPRCFVEPLRSGVPRARALLMLGVVYAVCVLLITWLGSWVDAGTLEALMELYSSGKATPDSVAEQLADPRLGIGLLLRFGLAALLSVPFWHAPALVHWGAQGVAHSLFSSTVACWRNRGAFTLFGLAWTGVVLAFALVANITAALLGQTQLIAMLAMPASLILSTIFYASLYFTFADCFELPDTERAAFPPPDAAAAPPTDKP